MIRVLLVDHYEMVREAFRLLLNAQDDMHVVGEASDGRAAIEQSLSLKPDVMVLELNLPGRSGLATVRGLRAVRLPVRLLVLTRHDDPAYVREVDSAGVPGYVLKQSPSFRLFTGIRAVAAGERYYDPALIREATRAVKRSAKPRLTRRETDVLKRMALGQTVKETAADLRISLKTVEVHRTNAMAKLGLKARTDVVRYAVLLGWLADP